jgi:hypothetical protein
LATRETDWEALSPDLKRILLRANDVPPPNWLLSEATVSLYEGKPQDLAGLVTNGYREKRIAHEIEIKPEPGRQLCVVRFTVTALVADDAALDRLAERRLALSKEMGIFKDMAALPKDAKKKMRGKYRVFDLDQLHVLLPDDTTKYPAVWAIKQKCPAFIKGVITDGNSMAPWRELYQTSASFTGLIETNKPAKLAVLVSIPKEELLLMNLKLRLEDSEPEPLKDVSFGDKKTTNKPVPKVPPKR